LASILAKHLLKHFKEMAKKPTYNDSEIKIVIRAFVQNNPKGLISELEKNHIYLQKPEDLKKVLFSLYKLQPLVFKKVLVDTAWDYNEPVTNSPEILKKMGIPTTQARTAEGGANAKEWWEQGLDILVGSEDSSTQTTTTTTDVASGGLTMKIIIGAVVLLVLSGVIWLIVSQNKGK
jgi:hypothetical protein